MLSGGFARGAELCAGSTASSGGPCVLASLSNPIGRLPMLVDGAPMEVCVPGGHTKYEEIRPEMFDRAVQHALSSLQLDVWPRLNSRWCPRPISRMVGVGTGVSNT